MSNDDVSLRDYIERILAEQHAALDIAFTAQQEALRTASAALDIKLTALTDKITEVNQLRKEVITDRGLYVTRIELEGMKEALQTAANANSQRVGQLENWRAKATGIGLVLVLFAGAVGAAIVKALGG